MSNWLIYFILQGNYPKDHSNTSSQLTETIIFSAVILIHICNKSISFIYHGSTVENRFLSSKLMEGD